LIKKLIVALVKALFSLKYVFRDFKILSPECTWETGFEITPAFIFNKNTGFPKPSNSYFRINYYRRLKLLNRQSCNQ